MPKNITRTVSKWRDSVSNGQQFVGAQKDSFTGCVGIRYEHDSRYEMSWDTGNLKFPQEIGFANGSGKDNKVVRKDGGSFLDDGFNAGDIVSIFTVILVEIVTKFGGVIQQQIKIIKALDISTVTDDTIVFNSVIDLDSEAENFYQFSWVDRAYLLETYDFIIIGLTKQRGIRYNYGFVENSDTYSNDSIIDGSQTGFYIDNVNVTPTIGKFLNENIKSNRYRSDFFRYFDEGLGLKTYRMTGAKGEEVQPFYCVQKIRFRHLFTLPDYKESWRTPILNGQLPPEFNGNNSIKFVNEVVFLNNYSDSNTAKSKIFDSQNGNIGHYNENFNGFINNYEVVSVSYVDKNNQPVPVMDIGGCTVTIKIKSNGNPFTTSTDYKRQFTLYHTSYRDAADYENKPRFYDSLLVKSNATINFDGGRSYDGILRNVEVIPDTSNPDYVATIKADIDFSLLIIDPEDFPNEGDFYGLNLVCCNNNIDYPNQVVGNPNNYDMVNLLVDANVYIKNTDIPGLLLVDRFEFFDHPTLVSGEGYTDYKGWIEDGIVCLIEAKLKTTALIQSLRVSMVAESESNYFEIESYNLDLSSQIVSSGIQNINTNQPVGFNLNENSQFNRLVIETLSTAGGYTDYRFKVPFKIPWQSWQSLNNADTVFFVNDHQVSNGLNKNASRYSGVNGYSIKMYLIADILQDDIVTEYIHKSPSFDIRDYDLPLDFVAEISTSDVDDVDLSGAVIQGESTYITATFTKEDHGLNVNELCGVIRMEVQRPQGIEIHEISSLNDNYNGILIPITGDKASISITDDTVVLRCRTNQNLIENVNYRISARLYPRVSSPASGDYNNDYNNDYDNI